MAQICPKAEQLLPTLQALERSVQAEAEESVSFRKQNSKFDKRNETTQLLLTVCEQLWNEKQSMEQSNFEEHTSELAYLCQHYKSSISSGVAFSAYSDELAAMQRKAGFRNTSSVQPRRVCGFCCSSEFPPQQSWWVETKQGLVPKFQVQRGGRLLQSAATELVRGDVVFMTAGQRAAADGRILVLSEGTAVDASHLTQRAHDVRICSSSSTGTRADESRNIIPKDSYIISGSLFCMVVRSPLEPLLPGTADSTAHQDAVEQELDCFVPSTMNMTQSACQSLFKALCSKAKLFCKAFRTIESLAGVSMVVITLTQELLKQGSVPRFFATMQKLKKAVVFVNCDCQKEDLKRLCQDLRLESIDYFKEGFEKPAYVSQGSIGNESAGESTVAPPTSTTSIDLTVLSGPFSLERLGDYEQAQYKRTLEKLHVSEAGSIDPAPASTAAGNASDAVVVNGISQAALLLLCRTMSSNGHSLLFAMSHYHYPKCLQLMAEKLPRGHAGGGRLPASLLGHSEAPTRTDSHIQSPDATPAHLPPPPSTPMAHHPTASSLEQRDQRTMMSFRSDPCGDLFAGGTRGTHTHSPKQSGVLGTRGQVFVSINSIGVVSDYSNCILLRPDLGYLGDALEMVSKKLKR